MHGLCREVLAALVDPLRGLVGSAVFERDGRPLERGCDLANVLGRFDAVPRRAFGAGPVAEKERAREVHAFVSRGCRHDAGTSLRLRLFVFGAVDPARQDDIYSLFQVGVTSWTPTSFTKHSLINGRWDQTLVEKQVRAKELA